MYTNGFQPEYHSFVREREEFSFPTKTFQIELVTADTSAGEIDKAYIPCVTDAKLTIFASAPAKDSKAAAGPGSPPHEARGQTCGLRTTRLRASGTSTTAAAKGWAGPGRFAQATSRRHRGGGSTGAGIRALSAHVLIVAICAFVESSRCDTRSRQKIRVYVGAVQ